MELEDDSSTSAQSESEGTGSLAQSWSELGSSDALEIEPVDQELPTQVGSHDQSPDQSQEGSYHQSHIILEEFKYDTEQGDIGNTRELQAHGETLLEWQFENKIALDTDHESGPVPEFILRDEEQNVTVIDSNTVETSDYTPNSLPVDTHQEQYITSPQDTIISDDAIVQREFDDSDKTPMQTSTTNPFQIQFEEELEVVPDNEEEPPHNEKDIETLLSLSTLTSSVGNTNPFLEYEEKEDDTHEEVRKPPVSTVLFSEVESISNHILPSTTFEPNPFVLSPPRSPTNPFLDDIENTSQTSSTTCSTLNQNTTNPFYVPDVRTPDSISPMAMLYSNEPRGASLNSSPARSQKLSSTQSSKQTSPSLSPVLGPPDKEPLVHSGPPSDDLSSCASSLDLSMVFESSHFSSQNHLQPKEDHFEPEVLQVINISH